MKNTEANSKQAQYVLYAVLEFAGIGLILWDGLPIYRHMMTLEQVATTNDVIIMWIAVAATQSSYWYVLRHEAPFRFPKRPFLAHVVLFLSRLIFIFASSLFALVVYRYSDAFVFSYPRVILFVAVLFSVFCFSRHLEAIGSLLLRGQPPRAE